MNFDKPWENISIKLIKKNQVFQFFDTSINILYVFNGEATFSYEDKTILLRQDDFVIIPKAKQSHLVINDDKVFLCKFNYTISLDKLNKYHYVFEGDSVENGSSKSAAIISTLQKIIQNYVFKDERPRFRVFQYYFEILALLEENFCHKEKSISSDTIYNKIEALSAYIKTNCENEIKLSKLAKQLYVSEQYLSRMFRKINGVNLNEFVVNCRMEKVTHELINTNKTITDIAFSSGFTNINSFNRLFKNKYNMTPKEFRAFKSCDIDSFNPQEDNINFDTIKAFFKEAEVIGKHLKINIEEMNFENSHYNQFLIGLGKLGELYQEPLYSQMDELKSLGFSYARINGWFDNNIIFADGTYDFFKIDLIIKKLLKMNIKIYFEINVHEVLVKEQILLNRVKCLFKHFVDTYGSDEVKRWIVDIVSIKGEGDSKKYVNQLAKNEQLEFFKIFENLKFSIKEIISDIKIGAGGIRIDDLYKTFINDFYIHSKACGVFPDFLSVSLYQFDKKNNVRKENEFEDKISPDPSFMRRKTTDLKNDLNLIGFDVKIVIVDFNITFSNYDIINDTSFKGTFIIKNILEIMDNCSIVGYGNFFDYLLRNEMNFEREIFGGKGLLSMNGLPKAGYFAFMFMTKNFLHRINEDKNIFISKNEDSSIITILVYNYAHLGIRYYYDSITFHKYNIYNAFEKSKENIYNIDLSNIITNREKNYKVLIERLGPLNGSFMEEVNSYTKEDKLFHDDVEYLKKCIKPIRRIEYLYSEKENHTIDIKINPHEFVNITIQQI
ncbi:helix-turn-helix domain-containing protein [Clostridium nigeriense]|uniref:helix-turn-helix domain-containing protein n=1 Tax=Clostridium nigeriense TaxID=1805470 RepID=UPI003D32771A